MIARPVFRPVSRGVSRRVNGISTTFTPLDLFMGGEQGAWYDPSDLSTLFKDAAGTTPVTADGDPVSLMLDKSKGLELGPELVTNGMFDTNISGWIGSPAYPTSSAVEWVNGALHVYNMENNHGESRSPAIPLTIGKRYVLEMDILDGTTAKYWIIIGSSPTNDLLGRIAVTGGTSPSGYKRWRYSFVASYDTAYLYFATNGVGGSHVYADNISVRELQGNHAAQAVAAARPIYRTDGTLHWLEFDGADDFMRVSNYQLPLQGDWNLYIGHSVKVVPTATENVLFGQYQGLGGFSLRMGPAGKAAASDMFFDGAASAPALPITTSPNVVSVRREGSLFTYESGGGIATLDGMGNITDTSIVIGSSTGGSSFYMGKVFGAVVRSSVFTATERQNCNNYLGSKIQ